MPFFNTSFFSLSCQSLCSQRPKIWHILIALLAIPSCLLAVYALLFTINSTLDLQKYKDNILKSYEQGFFEQNYPDVTIILKAERVDMWTECGSIGMAMRSHDSIDDVFLTNRYGNCDELSAAASQGFTNPPQNKYYRYTHGYSVLGRALYTHFSMQDARSIITIISITLLLMLGLALRAKVSTGAAAVILGSFLLLNSPSMYVLTTHAIQFWLVVVASILAIFLHGRTQFFILLACIGTLDAFFSILSMGSLSLSMPLLCFMLVKWKQLNNEDKDAKEFEILAQGFWACVAWAVGFLMPWLFKWYVITNYYNVPFAEILGTSASKYSASGIAMILLALGKNLLATNITAWLPLFSLLWWIRQKEGRSLPEGLWIIIFPALIPVLWCCILPGQSGISHSNFVNIILWPLFCSVSFYLLTPSKNASFKDLLPLSLRKL